MLKGVYTALITPFKKDGSFDEESFRRLVERQLKAGVSGIVPCGTTGESPTLSHEEHNRVIELACSLCKDSIEVIAGTGSNSTDEAIFLTKHAKEAGADYSLQIVPYYNKPTQKGMYNHFKKIAETVDLPMVVYNIQSRTGVNLETSTLVELSNIPNIIGVKEASGSIQQIMDVIKNVPKEFSVLSGDDALTLPLMSAGGHGVISVASNIIPEKMVEFVEFGLMEDYISMRKKHYELDEIFKKLFIETNPIPVKKILALKGVIHSYYRLPLCEPSEANTEVLKDIIERYEI